MLLSGLSLRLLARDAGAFCLLAVVALVVGLSVNRLRTSPLPLAYVSKEKRLDHAVWIISPPTQTLPTQTHAARLIDLDEFQKLVVDGSATILDARTSTFFRLGHVPGALNLSREAFEHDYAALRPKLEMSKDRTIAVYCSGADCQDSKLVAEALLKLGFETVLVYPEGWEQWTETGLPQEPPAKGGA